jgi:glyceraldehyde 3-phosphate dehydrogenase
VQIDYKGMGVKVVMECTGVYLTTAKCQPYFDQGVQKLVVSAPFKDSGDNIINIVKGCNHVRISAST